MAIDTDRLQLSIREQPWFRIDLSCRLDTPDFEDTLTWFDGSIVGFDRGFDDEFVLGRARLFVLRDRGHSLLDALDDDPETAEYMELFDPDTEELRSEVLSTLRDRWPAFGDSLLVLHQLALVPEVRGMGFGLHVLDRLINRMGHGYSVAVIKPFPLQFGSLGDSEEEWVRHLDLQRFTATREEGIKKLEVYYGQLDFVCVPDTKLMVRDLSNDPTYNLPTLKPRRP